MDEEVVEVEEEEEEAVSWASELLCFSPSLPVNWKSAGGSPSESAHAQSSLSLENTNTRQPPQTCVTTTHLYVLSVSVNVMSGVCFN